MNHAMHATGSEAVHVTRDGVDVIAHYGSVASEIAVCMKAAGLVERTDLDQIELRGRELFLDHALGAAISDGVPVLGAVRCVAGTWCCRPAPGRAQLAGPARAVDRWRAVIRRAVATTAIEVEIDSLPQAEALSIVGPRATAVVSAARLPGGMPAGSVADSTVGRSRVAVVREEQDRYLLLFGDGCSVEAWRALGEAGRPLGLAHVGQSALDHIRAAGPRAPLLH